MRRPSSGTQLAVAMNGHPPSALYGDRQDGTPQLPQAQPPATGASWLAEQIQAAQQLAAVQQPIAAPQFQFATVQLPAHTDNPFLSGRQQLLPVGTEGYHGGLPQNGAMLPPHAAMLPPHAAMLPPYGAMMPSLPLPHSAMFAAGYTAFAAPPACVPPVSAPPTSSAPPPVSTPASALEEMRAAQARALTAQTALDLSTAPAVSVATNFGTLFAGAPLPPPPQQPPPPLPQAFSQPPEPFSQPMMPAARHRSGRRR